MRRFLAVALAVAAMLWVRALGGAGVLDSRGTALVLGFTLLAAAWVAGDLLRRFHLPRLTGYLLFGLLIGPYLGNVINEGMARQLQAITGLATTLIALSGATIVALASSHVWNGAVNGDTARGRKTSPQRFLSIPTFVMPITRLLTRLSSYSILSASMIAAARSGIMIS